MLNSRKVCDYLKNKFKVLEHHSHQLLKKKIKDKNSSFKIFENIQKRKGMPVYNNEFLSVTFNNVYITFDQCI